MDYTKGDKILSLDMGFLIAICLEFSVKAYLQAGVDLGIRIFSMTREDIQEVGCQNHIPFPRNRLFPKPVQVPLGVVVMTEYLTIKLEDIKSREGGVLESTFD